MKPKTYNIAVIFPDWYTFLYDAIEGILAVHSIRQHCRFRNFISLDFSHAIEFPDGYEPDGLLVCYDEDRIDADWIDEVGVPVVNLYSTLKKHHPSVTTDTNSIAKQAVEHFAALGYAAFGYLRTRGQPSAAMIERALRDHCQQNNLPFWTVIIPDGIMTGAWQELENEAPLLKKKLVRPEGRTGIYAGHDMRGRLLVDYCTDLGINIPEDIGVLGRFDSINARLCTPELSSIVVPGKKIGVRAIQLLIELITGKEPSDLHPTLEATEIRVRQSTVQESDPDMVVIRARSIIRENACKGLTVDELIQSLPVARSTFEKRHRALTGSSPAQDIREARVAKSRELLLTTRKAIDEIAAEVGFSDARPFVVFFKREVGETPGEFRKKFAKQSF